MAASDWLAGYQLVVTIDGTEYPFKRVKLSPRAKLINRSNSKYSPGYMVQKAGIASQTMSCDGPYKEGEIPITVGGEYTWIFKPVSSHVGFTFLGIVESVDFDDDVEDGPNLSIVVQNSEEFDVVIE